MLTDADLARCVRLIDRLHLRPTTDAAELADLLAGGMFTADERPIAAELLNLLRVAEFGAMLTA